MSLTLIPGIETVSHRVARETLVMPDAGKSLLLGGHNDLSVANQRRGTVMIEGRNTKHVHWAFLMRWDRSTACEALE
jgi:hypothetical protein